MQRVRYDSLKREGGLLRGYCFRSSFVAPGSQRPMYILTITCTLYFFIRIPFILKAQSLLNLRHVHNIPIPSFCVTTCSAATIMRHPVEKRKPRACPIGGS